MKFICVSCKNIIETHGAVLFSSPRSTENDYTTSVHKYHICSDCESELMELLSLNTNEKIKFLINEKL
jgi:hypothetical protein